ncbi:MAG: DUF192 domain-containing protein [Candidatus Brocadiales bacterium]
MTNSLSNSILIVLIVLIAPCGQISAKDLTTIMVGGKEVSVELAVTAKERRIGMQFRTSLTEDHGMLFIFPTERHTIFWMKDTYIPLAVAFIKESGLITQIEEMEPSSLERHTSRENVKYALEMKGGWFKRNNVHVGDRVTIPLITDIATDKGKQSQVLR